MSTRRQKMLPWALGLSVILGLACASGTPGEATVDVDECAADGDDVTDETYIVWEFKDSVHEMITCGSLTFQLMSALIETAQTFLTDPAGVPSAFSYQDGGVYSTVGVGVAMDLVFRYGPDSPGGQAGDPVPHNLFDPDSYLVGADAVEEGDNLIVSFVEPGPLVALLGRGGSPQSPLTLSAADLANFAANLGSLKIKAQILVDDERIFSVITYNVDNPAVFVTDALLGMKMNMALVQAATGSRDDLGQQLTSTTWDVTYGDLAGTLDGVIEADVVGGAFDFHVRYDYSPLSVEPAIEITCL